MGILPDGSTQPIRIDLSHLSVSHTHSRDGVRIQIRDWLADAALVASLTPDVAAALSLCLDRAAPGVAEFAVRLDQAVAAAVYAVAGGASAPASRTTSRWT